MFSCVKWLVCSACFFLLIFPLRGPLTVSSSPSNDAKDPSPILSGQAAHSLNVKGSFCLHVASCPGLKFIAQGLPFSHPGETGFPLPCPPQVPQPFFLPSCGFMRTLFIFIAPISIRTTSGFPQTLLTARLQTSACCNLHGHTLTYDSPEECAGQPS